jgi:hypothetical protein
MYSPQWVIFRLGSTRLYAAARGSSSCAVTTLSHCPTGRWDNQSCGLGCHNYASSWPSCSMWCFKSTRVVSLQYVEPKDGLTCDLCDKHPNSLCALSQSQFHQCLLQNMEDFTGCCLQDMVEAGSSQAILQ